MKIVAADTPDSAIYDKAICPRCVEEELGY